MLFTSSTEEGGFAIHNRPSAIYKEILWYIQNERQDENVLLSN